VPRVGLQREFLNVVGDEVLQRLVYEVDVRQRGVRVLARERQVLQIRPAIDQHGLRVALAGAGVGGRGLAIDELQQIHQIRRR